MDAIHVASTGVLGMRSVITRNAGPRSLTRLDTGARYKVNHFGAWPSITLGPGAQVRGVSHAHPSLWMNTDDRPVLSVATLHWSWSKPLHPVLQEQATRLH